MIRATGVATGDSLIEDSITIERALPRSGLFPPVAANVHSIPVLVAVAQNRAAAPEDEHLAALRGLSGPLVLSHGANSAVGL